MKLTFVDAAVLIAAARGGSEQAARAMEILDDPERVTAEKPSRSIHRARAIKIVTIHPAPR